MLGKAVRWRLATAVVAFCLATPVWPQARVDSLTGTLAAKRGDEPARPLTLNAQVEQGEEVVTGPDSQASLVTSDGARVRVFPNSRLLVSQPSSVGRRLLHLFLGAVKVEIEKRSGRPNPHSMTTPTAIIAVRGTVFSVFVGGDESTRVAVDEGSVSVANVNEPSRTVTVGRGRQTLVERGRRPASPRRFSGSSEGVGTTAFPGSRGASIQSGGSAAGYGPGPGPGSTSTLGGSPGGARSGAGRGGPRR
jgi:hypothetical protein